MSNIKKNFNRERGFIKYIFYILIIILILSYLGFDLKTFIQSDGVKSNLGYVWEFILNLWKDYLKPVYDFLASWLGPYISDTLNGLRNHEDIIIKNIPTNTIPSIK